MNMSLKIKKMVLLFLIILDTLIISYLTISITHIYPKRYTEPPSADTGDISYFFNNELIKMIRNSSTLDIKIVDNRNYTFQGVPINEKRLFYTSEVISEGAVRIYAVLLKPLNIKNPPVIIFQHGYGQSWSDFYFLFKMMVAEGKFAVFAIDAPDCGNSSKLISKDPKNLLNISRGPEGSYIFHEAVAIMRGITFLKEIESFEKIIMSGVSMGGIQTFILTAVDDRVIAGIPIIATGNLLNVLKLPRLSQGMVVLSSEEKEVVQNFLKWFDLIHFARRIEKPVLYMMDTEDEYFDIISANDTFNALASNDKRFVIFPNGDHMGIPWVMNAIWNIINWVKYINGEAGYPEIESVSLELIGYPLFKSIKIRIYTSNAEGNKVVIYFRNSNPLAAWRRIEAKKVSDEIYEAEIVLFSTPLLSFFVAIEDNNGRILVSSPLYQTESEFTSIAIILATSLILTVYLSGPIRLNRRIMKALFLSAAFLALFELPVFAILGRGQWSIWDIIEVYKILIGVTPVFFFATLIVISLSPILSYYKERAFHALYLAIFLLMFCLDTSIIIIELTMFSSYLSWSELPIFYGYGLFISFMFYILPYLPRIRERLFSREVFKSIQ